MSARATMRGGAHAYLLRNFPPYRISLIALPIALVLAAAGFWLRAPAYVIPHPVSGGAPSPPAGPSGGGGGGVFTGDKLACLQSNNSLPLSAAGTALAACQRVIAGTGSGDGDMPAWQANDGAALSLMALHRFDEAYASLQRAIEAAPNTARPYALRAMMNNNLGKYAAGIADSNSALALDGNSLEARLSRAVAEVSSGDAQNGFDDANTVVRATPGDLFAHLILGEAEAGLRQWSASEQETQSYLRAFPGQAWALYWHGLAEEHLPGGLQTAIAEFTESARNNPHFANPHKELGLIAFRSGNWNEVLDQESQALAIDPANAGAYTARSGAEIRLGRFRDGQDDAARALHDGASGPVFVAAEQNLGIADMSQGDFADAVTALQAAHDADPQDTRIAGLLDRARHHQN